MITPEQEFFKAHELFSGLVERVRQSVVLRGRVDQVEQVLFRELTAVGLSLLKAFVLPLGDGDAGDSGPRCRLGAGIQRAWTGSGGGA